MKELPARYRFRKELFERMCKSGDIDILLMDFMTTNHYLSTHCSGNIHIKVAVLYIMAIFGNLFDDE